MLETGDSSVDECMRDSLTARMWEDVKTKSRFGYDVLYSSVTEYNVARVSRMSAAVAYRTLFALTPVFIISVGLLGLIVGSDTEAQKDINEAITAIAGEEVTKAFQTFVGTALAGSGSATLVGVVLLFWTTSSLFSEVQNDLNDIFHVPYEKTAGAVEFLKKRGWGFLWGFGIGVLVLTLWIANIVWQYFEGFFLERNLDVLHTVVAGLTPLVSIVFLPIFFALMYQSLTDVRIVNRALIYGSVFAGLGFAITAWGAGIYFTFSSDTSAAQVTASLFVLILLAYVLSGVFLFGAVVIKVHHDYLANGDVLSPTERRELMIADLAGADVVVADPPTPMPVAAVSGFLAGLFVGWRKTRR